ncbi:MAG TPA: MFS transporter [Nonomuraea sp.]|nr:MFS transporter [Nonomuraea sp.]
MQWVVDAYALTLAAVLLPAGVLADQYGRRRLLAIGVIIFTLASLACALAPSAPLLDLARGAQGLGAGNVVANQVGLTAPMDRVGMATGIANTLKQVGTAVGVAVLAAPYSSGVGTMLLVAAGLALAGALLPLALAGPLISRSPRPPAAGSAAQR